MKNTADPDPTRCDSRSQVFDPWSRPFSGLWPSYDPAILQWLGVYGILRSIYLANSFERLLCYPAAWICLRLPLNVLFFAHAIQTHNSFYDTHVRLWIWAANCFVSEKHAASKRQTESWTDSRQSGQLNVLSGLIFPSICFGTCKRSRKYCTHYENWSISESRSLDYQLPVMHFGKF